MKKKNIIAVTLVLFVFFSIGGLLYAKDSFYVIPVPKMSAINATIVSAYGEIVQESGETDFGATTIYTVPIGKVFILTDIIKLYGGPPVVIPNTLAIDDEQTHFNSGIPFASGSNVNFQFKWDAPGYYSYITISGYLIDDN